MEHLFRSILYSGYCGVRAHRARIEDGRRGPPPIVRNKNPLNLSRKRVRFETGTPGSFSAAQHEDYKGDVPL